MSGTTDLENYKNCKEYKDFIKFKERFTYYFNIYNIAFTEKIILDFYIFTQRLLTENAKYNLTSITGTDDIIVKHYIDSVIALKYFNMPENASVIDIGSGAGFPSVPLRIMRGDLNITFLDGSEKKINFIKSALNKISESDYKNYKNCADYSSGENIFYRGRAEDAGKDLKLRGKYGYAVSRAVAKLNVLCELAAPMLKQGGYFIAYKGRNAAEEITEAQNALNLLGLNIEETKEFNIYVSQKINKRNKAKEIKEIKDNGNGVEEKEEEDNKRTLIKIKKINKTSAEYPRNFSNITKNPL